MFKFCTFLKALGSIMIFFIFGIVELTLLRHRCG
ncbi:hypothetical protein LINPERHAP2_LOCUS24136 [Linum perenne]